MISAYSFFAQKILEEGAEGAFFSVQKPGTLNQKKWIFGWGKPINADFEKGPFPFFSVTNFEGNKSLFLHFENWISFDLEGKNEFERNTKVLEEIEFSFLNKPKTNIEEKKERFVKNIDVVQEAQKNGECWVLNLAQDFVFEAKNKDKQERKKCLLGSFYRFLKSEKPHCGGVFITNEYKFCSFSPEVFLLQDDLNISTFPIKGTGQEVQLKSSEKEIAELSMVTDLLRNDLGQICKRVETPNERFLTAENNFFHAQSHIKGTLKKTLNWEDFQKLLPAGSISGAPKKRVVEKIKSLENFERELYTGTFGVRFSPQNSVFSILIRTLFLKNDLWHFPVGAGITIDSEAEEEFVETLLKMNVLNDFCFL